MRFPTCFAGAAMLLGLAGCPDDAPPPEPQWFIVAEQLPGALISTWGRSATDVWMAGANRGGGAGPTVIHFDGTTWSMLDTGQTSGDLWWVHGFAPGEPIYFGGTEGTILRYDGTTFTRMTTPGTTP